MVLRLSPRTCRAIKALHAHGPAKVQASAARSRRRAARLAVQSFDRAGRVRSGSVTHAADVLTIRLPFRAFSPSASSGSLWGGGWRLADAEKRAWIARLEQAAVDGASRLGLVAFGAGVTAFATPARLVDWHAPHGRALLVCRRLVTRETHKIHDFDNLAYAFKGLIDVVVRAEFLRGDADRHVARRYEQAISPDGLDWTEIVIDARPGAARGL